MRATEDSAIIRIGTAAMYTTWSGPEGSSHTNLCLRVPFFVAGHEV